MNTAQTRIDAYLATLPGWQAANLQLFRQLIHDVDDSIAEDWKWDVPVFTLDGKTLFAMSAFKAHTKYNFIANGALLADRDRLFNNGLESKRSRGIDLHENGTVDRAKLRALIADAASLARG